MNNHRYILEPYSGMKSRYHCPVCGEKHKFTRYVDNETGRHIAPNVGRCDRESSCGYHYTPKQYFIDNDVPFNDFQKSINYKTTHVSPSQKPCSFIPDKIFRKSLQIDVDILVLAKKNNFIKYLISLFGVDITNDIIKKYSIGTSKHWNGSTVFWQQDIQGNVRTGKIMLYNPITGKRIKEPFNHITWVHTIIKQPEFQLKQCFFGEHLFNDKTKPIAVVESEKTACIASVYFPQFIWVATSGAGGLSIDKCNTLNMLGQAIVLFPDISKPIEGKETTFEKWTTIANKQLKNFTISDLLEIKTTAEEKKHGLDIADYLIKFDFNKFLPFKTEQTVQPSENQARFGVNQNCLLKRDNETKPLAPENWDNEIAELEQCFKTIAIPDHSLQMKNGIKIINVELFIESHLEYVKANNGKKTYRPYLERLQELKHYLLPKPFE